MATTYPIQGFTARPSCLRGVPSGGRDIPDKRPRTFATQSLANASGYDGWTLRVPPLVTDASGQHWGVE